MKFGNMTNEQILELLKSERDKYLSYKAQNLKLDMTRGKPCKEQLDLSCELLKGLTTEEVICESGLDCRNYGVLSGIPEAKRIMSILLGMPEEQIIAGGNSSLNMMYDVVSNYVLHGASESDTPWYEDKDRAFICPVPGYDRHFAVTEKLGFKMIPVEIDENGPDMAKVRELVKDPHVKGMWSVPKYSNPTGYVYSDEVIKELASMETAFPYFRIIWDDAYTVHSLYGAPCDQLNLYDACKAAGNEDRGIIVASTSKISYPGNGLAAIGSSKSNIDYLLKLFTVETIGPDKINQIRLARYLKDADNIAKIMEKHADILRPKFDKVLEIFERDLGGTDFLEWTKPMGGYFISINTLDGLASKVVKMAGDIGVGFTPAGSTYPLKKDPRDRNIRIAPSFPSVAQIETAIEILCVCVKICSYEKILEERKI